jgi:hypothetical protein
MVGLPISHLRRVRTSRRWTLAGALAITAMAFAISGCSEELFPPSFSLGVSESSTGDVVIAFRDCNNPIDRLVLEPFLEPGGAEPIWEVAAEAGQEIPANTSTTIVAGRPPHGFQTVVPLRARPSGRLVLTLFSEGSGAGTIHFDPADLEPDRFEAFQGDPVPAEEFPQKMIEDCQVFFGQ